MDIILVEPEIAGNIGAIARVMKNFRYERLVLVQPQCDITSAEAKNRAKHANDVLENATVVSSLNELTKEYDYLIGTTGAIGNDYNIKRSPLTPRLLARKVGHFTSKAKAGLVFGRESQGLSNDELSQMDFVVHIPTHEVYPIMNLSHAVAVILYEIYVQKNNEKMNKKFTPITMKDKKILLEMIDSILDSMHFQKGEDQKETQKLVWKQLLGKAMLTRREAFALMGFFRKLQPQDKK